ncbi:MAG TPA: hypothetical protein VK892_14165 [Pyrinomonadaceae bacterium]|nr:hypothetical protein [Pyrinomonadaceae bacterium]
MMKNQINRSIALILIVLVIISAGVILSKYTRTQAQNSVNTQRTPERLQQAMARRQVIELDDPQWRQNVALPTLGAESTTIIIGRALRNVSRQSASESVITTDYDIEVQEIIKGNLQPNSTVSVSLPGGLIKQADGSFLEVRTRNLRKMRNGRTYVLFLKDAAGQNSGMTTVRGSQGIYEIPQNGQRVIHLGRSFELPPDDDGQEISVFLQAIRALNGNR